MPLKKSKILLSIAGSRLIISRIFAVLIILIVVFTSHSFQQETTIDTGFEIVGLFLLTICSMGRLWALMYISGYKSKGIITDGPYSIVRHPLYMFSLIGAVGIGFASENLLVLGLIVIFYFLYYPLTILAEEEKLANKFGEVYLEYMKHTPRFLPNLRLYKEPESYKVNTAQFFKNFIDGLWFMWIFILLHFIEKLQTSGVIPILFRVP